MADPLRSSSQIVLEHPPAEQLEPSDEELAADYRPSFPHSPDPAAQVFFGGELLPFKEAVQRERSQFIARRRRAIQDKQAREEQARIAAIEAERKRQEFEAGAKEGKGRGTLKDALVVYQQLLDQAHDLESALGEARAAQAFLRTDADPSNDKFARSLAAAGDQVAAAEVRLQRVGPLLKQAAEITHAGNHCRPQ